MSQASSYILFPLGKKRFALPAKCVAELVQQGVLQTFPQSSPMLCGVLLHRGVIIAVCDLAALLVAPERPPQKYFLLVWWHATDGDEMVAIPVSGECELCTAEAGERRIGQPEYVLGLLALAGETVEVLDLERILMITERSGAGHVRHPGTGGVA